MNKQFLVSTLLFVAIIVGLFTETGTSQILPPGDLSVSNGYKAVATQTISVVASSAQIIGTIPSGCYQVEVISDKGVKNLFYLLILIDYCTIYLYPILLDGHYGIEDLLRK